MSGENHLPGVGDVAPGGESSAPSVAGADPPDEPDESDVATLEESAGISAEGRTVLRVAVEDPDAVERVVAAVTDEPSIVATSVGLDEGPDDPAAFDVLVTPEHDPEAVVTALAAVPGVTGVAAATPFGRDPPSEAGSDGPAERGSEAAANPVFEELKRETDQVGYDELVAELETVGLTAGEGEDVDLGELLDEGPEADAPTDRPSRRSADRTETTERPSDAAAGGSDATGERRRTDAPDPAVVLDALMEALEDADLSRAQQQRFREAAGLPRRPPLEARVDRLEGQLDEFAAYATALEDLLDATGGLSLADLVERHTDHEARLADVERRTDDVERRTETVARVLAKLVDRQRDHDRRLETVESGVDGLATLDQRLDEVEAELADVAAFHEQFRRAFASEAADE